LFLLLLLLLLFVLPLLLLFLLFCFFFCKAVINATIVGKDNLFFFFSSLLFVFRLGNFSSWIPSSIWSLFLLSAFLLRLKPVRLRKFRSPGSIMVKSSLSLACLVLSEPPGRSFLFPFCCWLLNWARKLRLFIKKA